MSGIWVPLTVLQRFLAATLNGDMDVVTDVGGAGRIFPDVAPSTVQTRFLVHEDYGGNVVAKGIGASIGMVTMAWAITAWEPGYSRQALEPVMKSVKTVLIGPDGRGKQHRHIDAEGRFSVYVDYVGPDKVPLDLYPAGTWAPIREVYSMALQRLGA